MNLPHEERKQIENEMLFRRINEKVGSDLDDLDALHLADGNPHLVRSDDLLLEFNCECSDENCQERVAMKLSHYKELHIDRSAFIIMPDHELNEIEKVIESTDTYSVVRKHNVTPEPRLNAAFNQTDVDNSKI